MSYTLRRHGTVALLATALASGALVAPRIAAADDVRIHDIQGTTRLSSFQGSQVTDVPGTVTAIRAFGSARGFWIQDTKPDTDPATSEGVFVFTGSTTPNVAVGDAVAVSGTVIEYYPGGAASGGQSLTQLTHATWTVTSPNSGLPQAYPLTARNVPDRYVQQPGGSTEAMRLRPHSYALDLYESLEGMRVQLKDSRVVGPSTRHNELWVTAEPRQNKTVRGGTLYGSYEDQNSGRVKVSSLIPFSERPFPRANVGDQLAGRTEGPLDYDRFGGYEIQATILGELRNGGLKPERTRAQKRFELAVATYNVENLSPADRPAKFGRLARAVVDHLASPDILTLEEIQDDNGPTNDAVVSAEATLRRFTEAITAAGGPAYEWRQIDPADDQDGGQPGGNIRVAFLFNPERVGFTDRPGGDATTAVRAVEESGEAALTISPGRIDPGNGAWEDSRKPLVGEFTFRGRTVFVIANHFTSKGGDQGLDSRFQPPARPSETQRTQQAAAVNELTQDLLAIDPQAHVIAAGDFNDFPFSPAMNRLTGNGRVLVDLIDKLPRRERYSYVFNGNSQALDHILASGAIRDADYDVIHINAEFADQASDHDPQVLRFRPRR